MPQWPLPPRRRGTVANTPLRPSVRFASILLFLAAAKTLEPYLEEQSRSHTSLGHRANANAKRLDRKANRGTSVVAFSERFMQVVHHRDPSHAENPSGTVLLQHTARENATENRIHAGNDGNGTLAVESAAAHVKGDVSSVSGGEQMSLPLGKVHFLFMAFDDLPNKEIWARFFSQARHGIDYDVFVHCKYEHECREKVASFPQGHLFRTIPAVESEWCDNLVSPMDALLATALDLPIAADGGRNDKFVFLSDTTVPVKPFKVVQRRLTLEDGTDSNFCVAPESDWAWHRCNGKPRDVAVKHHQWMVLARAHANQIVRRRADERNIMRDLTPLHWLGTTWIAPFLQDFTSFITLGNLHGPHAKGCLDEFLYFALVYGFLNRSGIANLPGFKGSVRIIKPGLVSEDLDFQGQCDTFDYFGYGTKFKKIVERLVSDGDSQLQLSEPNMHPARFAKLSAKGLRILRDSEYLFARKVDKKSRYAGNLSLSEAFEQHVFS
eukprot:TRINITY_DN43524_c0_g1_i1.p1 TRINITY_DN43524_c0_g1~~TRINITY_DN43524_c0_g1_i1.p1  ORF type:complete len:495 (+),score=62.23 TRINITY_DN43524_c0_g1_i1:140-1624(+)